MAQYLFILVLLTGHGIRATVSTALNELGYHKDWVEAQLSHADTNQIRRATTTPSTWSSAGP